MNTKVQIDELTLAVSRQVQLFKFLARERLELDDLAQLSSLVELPMAVVDFHGHLVFNNTGLPAEGLMNEWPWHQRPSYVRVDGVQLQRRSLCDNGNRLGNILLSKSNPLAAETHVLIEQVMAIVSRALAQREARVTSDLGTGDFAQVLCRYLAGAHSVQTLQEVAVQNGVGLPSMHYFCALVVNGADQRSKPTEEVMKELGQHVAAFLWVPVEGLVTASVQQGQLLLLPVLESHSEKAVRNAFVQALERLAPGMQSDHLRLAISRRKTAIEDLAEAHSENQDSLRVSKGLALPGRVFSFGDMEFYMLFEGMSRERMLRYNRIVFKSLHSSKTVRDLTLLSTLETFIQNEAQIPETAKALGVHKNTVAYRLEQIAETIGLNVRKTSDLLRIKLAFSLRRILERTALDKQLKEE